MHIDVGKEEELCNLNQAVIDAILKRRYWLDKIILENSPLKVGDD